ncbi:hypothetical protein CDAR_556531 [Caerostris darwini]|uniref:Uncharacterized protein n=1 Tax=Caerostris darwini TaxID=1538125 RepID=A0AAV4S7F8_9ARAC|nr:hypothetical protein CDAR_556531 [Caerostris darwini]
MEGDGNLRTEGWEGSVKAGVASCSQASETRSRTSGCCWINHFSSLSPHRGLKCVSRVLNQTSHPSLIPERPTNAQTTRENVPTTKKFPPRTNDGELFKNSTPVLSLGKGRSEWKRKEMEGEDENLRTEGWDDLERQESHHAPGLPKLVLALPDAVGSIISLPCLLTVA